MKSVRDRSFPYRHREKTQRNWSLYDRAQIHEIADILETIRNIVDIAVSRVPARRRGPGRPPVPQSDIVKVMLMQAYFGMPNRIAEGFLRLFGEKLGLSEHFSYKTLERGYDPSRTEQILDLVLEIVNAAGNHEERVFSTDGTGDPTSMKINYESKRTEQRLKGKGEGTDAFPGRRHDFQYSVFAAGVHTKLIAGFDTSDDHSMGELSYFPHVVERTRGLCPKAKTMLGDALYANRKSCATAAARGMKHYFMPKSNASFLAHGSATWKRSLYDFVDSTQEWLEEYHMRSISECVNSMIKRKMPFKIRKKLPQRKKTEESLKINMHNLRQYSYLRHTNPEIVQDYREIHAE